MTPDLSNRSKADLIAEIAQLKAQVTKLQASQQKASAMYLDTLHDTILMFLHQTNIDDILAEILKRAVRLTDADGGYLCVPGEGGSMMRFHSTTGIFAPYQGRRVSADQDGGIIGDVWRTSQQQVAYGDPASAPWLLPGDDPARYGFAAYPLLIEGDVLGVCGVACHPKHVFTPEALEALETFTSLAAIALQNAQRYNELNQNQNFIEQIANTTPDILYVYDLVNNDRAYVNRAITDILGFPVEQMNGDIIANVKTMVHPDDHAAVQAELMALIENRQTYSEIEYRVRDSQRHWHWFHARHKIFARTADGQPSQILGILQEISDRKHTEQVLLEGEERFRTLIDNAPEAILVLDPTINKIIDANQNAIEIFGYDFQQITQLDPLKIISLPTNTEDPVQVTFNRIIQQAANGQKPIVEVTGQTASGEEREFELRMVNLPGANTLIRVSAIDITERRQTERDLRQSEERFRTLINAIPINIFIYHQGRIVYVNPAAEALLGYGVGDLADGGGFMQAIAPESRRYIQRLIMAFEARKAPQSRFEFSVIDINGEAVWLDVTTVEVYMNGERMLLGAALDVTERREDEARKLALALERERVQLLADFVRDASHDFRTPLSNINTSVYLLKRENDPARVERHYELITEQVSLIDRLVDALLTMSKLDSGIALSFSTIYVNNMLRELYHDLMERSHQKSLNYELDLTDDLPNIVGDTYWLYRALREIVKNAIQYTPAEGTLIVRSIAYGNGVQIIVSDTGPGIPPDEIPKVFERFYRGDELRVVGGLGLGLAIAHKVIHYHGGQIDVDSTPGQGSTFTVTLPPDGLSD